MLQPLLLILQIAPAPITDVLYTPAPITDGLNAVFLLLMVQNTSAPITDGSEYPILKMYT